MKFKNMLAALTMAVMLSILSLTSSPCLAQNQGNNDQLPDMIETTSEELFQVSGPGDGIMLALYRRGNDPQSMQEELLVRQTVGSNPNWRTSIQLRQVDITADTQTGSLIEDTPLLVMTVNGHSRKLRVLNAATGALLDPQAVHDFIANGIETMNHPRPLTGQVQVQVQEVSFDRIHDAMQALDKRQAVILLYSRKSYLSVVLKSIFQQASAELNSSDLAWLSVDVSEQFEQDQHGLGTIPLIEMYQEDDRGKLMHTAELRGFHDQSSLATWLQSFSTPDPIQP